jgi:hypothetical protein
MYDRSNRQFCLFLSACLFAAAARGDVSDAPAAAQAFGKTRPALTVQPDGLYVCEAEEFQVAASSGDGPVPGWQARRFGENYYAATFANCFLSRKAFLGAPEQCDETIAAVDVEIEQAGRYLVLVRYEAAYRFETQFRIRVEQAGRTVLNRLYGARSNTKIWAFREGLKTEVAWSWGAVENVVWEGHDAFVALRPGRATIRMIAGRQPEPAARRNVDLVMLTTDAEQVKMRIEKENYLPLDGLLTQSGDVFLRVTNRGQQPLVFTGRAAPGGGNWQQHSPYWVHLRNWKIPSIEVEAGKRTDWIEVGGLMDSLADGQWSWTGNGPYVAEFGVKDAAGQIVPLAEFTGQGDLKLAADADTRYSRRLRTQDAVLYDLLADLKQANPSPHGRAPRRTPIYASTFEALDQGKHAAAVAEFKRLFSLSDTGADAAGGRGYIDVRGVATDKLAEYCQKLGPQAANIAVVSLGDEISLPNPGGDAVHDDFRQWLKGRGMKPSDIQPAAGADWAQVVYNPDPKSQAAQPATYYWSMRYRYDHGIRAIKQRTDILRQHLPNAAVGANYSPHYPSEHMFLGEVFKWVSVFREGGMTLPWSEDYIWQVPIATPQMNQLNFALFRAALRDKPDGKIMYYVMPHMPNNTPNQWRRLFYGSLAGGMKMVNLFEFRPVHVAYTENHVDHPEMYRMVLGSFRELGLFEEIVQDGQVRPAQAALWFSETGDIWGDSHGSFAAGKRTLYTAILHQQIPLDIVVEQDALDGTLDQYRALYLTDAHVSRAASQKIAAWVNKGGRLLATAGAGMYDELNQPNAVLRELLGIEPTGLDEPDDSRVIMAKQDLPFARVIDRASVVPDRLTLVSPQASWPQAETPVIGVRSRFQTRDAQLIYAFADGSPAVASKPVGQGWVAYCGFLPGLSYYHPAIPLRPVDRGATDDSMIHFLPTDFDPVATAIIQSPVAPLFAQRPVVCSQPLVESAVIQSPHGIAIPLINWTQDAIVGLQVHVSIPALAGRVSLASGRPVRVEKTDTGRRFVLDLDVADALILR